MRSPLPKFGFLAALALLVTATSGVQAQTPTALPLLDGATDSNAFWINDWAEVAGTNSGGSRGLTAVVWDENGTPTPLPPLEGDTGSSITPGNSINNKGEIAGKSFGGVNGTRGVVWNRNGTILRVFQPLEPGGNSSTEAIAISAHGRVVGVSGDLEFGVAPPRQAVVWDQKGNPTVLSQPGFCLGSAKVFLKPTSITPQTRVSGRCADGIPPPRGEGVVWNRKGEVAQRLPPLPGEDSSNGWSMNSKGEVAGDSSDSGPVVWDQKGSPRALLTLPGWVGGSALAINNKGVVAGITTIGNNIRAVMWDRDGNPTLLPPLAGAIGAIARGINRRNVVVGVSDDGFGNSRAVVWR